jgi:hypothetical protein
LFSDWPVSNKPTAAEPKRDVLTDSGREKSSKSFIRF